MKFIGLLLESFTFMPTYTFRNTTTEEIEEYFMPISELDKFKEDNPHLKKVILNAPPTLYGNGKVPDGFKDRLKEIKKNTPGATFEIP